MSLVPLEGMDWPLTGVQINAGMWDYILCGKNGNQDYLAHELIVVSSFGSDAASDLNMGVVTAADPGFEVLNQT